MFFSTRQAGSANSPRYVFSVVCFLTVAVLLPSGVPLLAQEPPPVFPLPDVIAPGRRVQPAGTTPASISVLTAKDLARLGVRTVGDALRFLPEVTVRDFGGPGALQEVSIRGTGSAHVLVLVDGVPINSPALGIAQVNTIPVDTRALAGLDVDADRQLRRHTSGSGFLDLSGHHGHAPVYTLVGLRYSLTTGLGTWQVGVDNLFDVAYEPVKGFPSPGRTVFVSLSRGF